MNINRRTFVALSALALVTSLGAMGCGPETIPELIASESTPRTPANPVTLTISAAGSLTNVLEEVKGVYETENPQVSITYNFGASGSLAQQILQGAPSDVFLSASEKWMDELENQGQLRADSRRNLLQNELVLIVLKDRTGVSGFEDLAAADVTNVAMGEPESVPAGQYAKETLTSLQIFTAIEPKLVLGKNVQQLLSYVETGNAEAGLVFATDAQGSEQVRVVATAPPETHSPIVYPVAVVQDSTEAEAAHAFVNFLSSEQAIAIFQAYGFTMVE